MLARARRASVLSLQCWWVSHFLVTMRPLTCDASCHRVLLEAAISRLLVNYGLYKERESKLNAIDFRWLRYQSMRDFCGFRWLWLEYSLKNHPTKLKISYTCQNIEKRMHLKFSSKGVNIVVQVSTFFVISNPKHDLIQDNQIEFWAASSPTTRRSTHICSLTLCEIVTKLSPALLPY
jgi:hypothetical protein